MNETTWLCFICLRAFCFLFDSNALSCQQTDSNLHKLWFILSNTAINQRNFNSLFSLHNNSNFFIFPAINNTTFSIPSIILISSLLLKEAFQKAIAYQQRMKKFWEWKQKRGKLCNNFPPQKELPFSSTFLSDYLWLYFMIIEFNIKMMAKISTIEWWIIIMP